MTVPSVVLVDRLEAAADAGVPFPEGVVWELARRVLVAEGEVAECQVVESAVNGDT